MLALIVSGAIGGTVLTRGVAQPALVHSDLQSASAPSFSAMVAQVKPAVVSIKVAANGGGGGLGDTRTPTGMPQFWGRPAIREGAGFFVTSDGAIVTNNHVVENAAAVSVIMHDGKVLRAHVVGADPRSDLAVVKVDEKGVYPFVSFAREAPKIGDWVVAIGNPYGLGGTATAGIVSAQRRSIAINPYDEFIQIDAPINKGNSGGPTFNTRGEVIGVNTAIFSPSGGSVGVGFAIPADTAAAVVGALERDGRVTRGYLGVKMEVVTQDIAQRLGLTQIGGAIVYETEPGTAAAAAGLISGDVITRVNGQQVEKPLDLTRSIGALKPGGKAELTYLRYGVENTVTVTLGALQSPQVAKASPSTGDVPELLGVELAPAGEVAGAGDRGVAIIDINPNGAAAARGLGQGDVILGVSGKPVSSPEDVRRSVAAAKQEGKKAVLIQVRTATGDHFVAFALTNA